MIDRKPTLWLTRSKPAAFKSAEVWAKAGCACGIAPLLHIAPPDTAPLPPAKDSCLIFTSANAVTSFADLSDRRHHTVITVGDATAEAAKATGFTDVVSAQGSSDDVTRLIIKSIAATTPITHCAGADVRGSIVEDLQAAGYEAARHIYYQSAPVHNLPNLDFSQLDYVALYSPKAAETLAKLAPDMSNVTALSISPATDAALGALALKARRIASAPNETAMLALLKP